MKVTPQRLRELADFLEESGKDWSEMPPASTLFNWMVDWFATEMDSAASDFRFSKYRSKYERNPGK